MIGWEEDSGANAQPGQHLRPNLPCSFKPESVATSRSSTNLAARNTLLSMQSTIMMGSNRQANFDIHDQHHDPQPGSGDQGASARARRGTRTFDGGRGKAHSAIDPQGRNPIADP